MGDGDGGAAFFLYLYLVGGEGGCWCEGYRCWCWRRWGRRIVEGGGYIGGWLLGADCRFRGKSFLSWGFENYKWLWWNL